jgi:hypothetical protein
VVPAVVVVHVAALVAFLCAAVVVVQWTRCVVVIAVVEVALLERLATTMIPGSDLLRRAIGLVWLF